MIIWLLEHDAFLWCHKAAVELAKDYQAKVIVMIRPRGGDFVYSQQELAIMLEDIKCARDLGVDGFALGALTSENQLDTEALKPC